MFKADVRFANQLPAVQAEIRQLLTERMTVASRHLADRVKTTLSGLRSGRRYLIPGLKPLTARARRRVRGRERRKYTASAPGEAPAVRFGQLRGSISYRVAGEGRHAEGSIGSPLQTAVWLEQGTSRMAPRPFLAPTFRREQARVEEILAGKSR